MTKLEQVAEYFDREAERVVFHDDRVWNSECAAAIREAMAMVKAAYFEGWADCQYACTVNVIFDSTPEEDWPESDAARAILNTNPEGTSDAE